MDGRSFTKSQELKQYYNIPRPLISTSFSISDFVIIQRFDASSLDTAVLTLRLAGIGSKCYSFNFLFYVILWILLLFSILLC